VKNVRKAVELFNGSEGEKRLNCAQSILKAFQMEHDVPDELIEEFSHLGGGASEGGFCGALYAVEYLMKESGMEKDIPEIESVFRKHAGSTKCAIIRKMSLLDCSGCVEQGAEILHERKSQLSQ